MMRGFIFRTVFFALFAGTLIVCGSVGQVMAQEASPPVASPSVVAAAPDGASVQPAATAGARAEQGVTGELDPNKIPSVLFTYWEHTAISDAKNSRGLVRPPTEEELMRDLKTKQADKVKPPPEEREIKLGGIVYVTSEDWTVWLNGKRVTPGAIPSEVLDLKVRKEYIEMKWFDDYTNQIFPIRLRAHQRFNIDTRIFLPG